VGKFKIAATDTVTHTEVDTKCRSITGCATHHSYGSLAWLSEFFRSRLWGSDSPTNYDAKWLKRRAFTKGCTFCSKNCSFSYPL